MSRTIDQTYAPLLRVMPVHGEPTAFYVESSSLQCTDFRCEKLFSRRLRPDLRVGSKCPKCDAKLDLRFHLVRLDEYEGNGKCACEYFHYSEEKILRRASKEEQAEGRHRCQHIEAAREYALDLAIRLHSAADHPRALRRGGAA